VRGYRGEADLFLVYCADTEQVYAVDVEEVGACEVKLREAPTANNQERGIRWAADYLLPA
jgi:PD-(D/E)XK endonuclease